MSRNFRFITRLMFILAILYTIYLIFMFLTSEVGIFDEGIQLLGGLQTYNNLTPHIDFWSTYTPLNYYLIALFYSLFGVSVISLRLLQVLFYLLVIFFFIWYLRSFKNSIINRHGILIWIPLFAIGFNFSIATWNGFAVNIFSLVCYLMYVREFPKKNYINLFFSGLFTGLGFLMKINFAGYFAIGIIIDIIIQYKREKIKKTLFELIIYSIPMIIPILIYFLIYSHSIGSVLDQVILFPAQELEHQRIITFSLSKLYFIFSLAVIFPFLWFGLRLDLTNDNRKNKKLIILVISTVVILFSLFAINQSTQFLLPKLFIIIFIISIFLQFFIVKLSRVEFIIILCYSLFLHYFLSRADSSHYYPLTILIMMFIPFLKEVKKKLIGILLIFILLIPTIFPIIGISRNLQYLYSLTDILDKNVQDSLFHQNDSEYLMSNSFPFKWPYSSLYRDQDEINALQYVYKNTNANENVYIGMVKHSQIYVNDLRSYFMLGRKIGVKRYELEPGMATEGKNQKEIIRDLQKNNVSWIVLWKGMEGDKDFVSRKYIGANILDQYITSNYKEIKRYGKFRVMNLK